MLFEEIINVKTKKKKKFFTEETNKHYNIYSKLYDLYNNAKVIDLIIEASLQDMMGLFYHGPADSSNIRMQQIIVMLRKRHFHRASLSTL